MLNILINAYAVSPNWGSEPGMGWNWIVNIAKYCNVFVITEGEWEKEIIEAVSMLPQKNNIHFYFNPLPDAVRKICWNQGDWRFYWYYRKWQKKTLQIARQIISEHSIDVIHQLNMVGFREPGYLWKIKNIPIVWGPVGGMGYVPKEYRSGVGLKSRTLLNLKYFISDMQVRFHPRVRRMIKHSYMFGAVKNVQTKVKRYYGKDIPLINETGIYLNLDIPTKMDSSGEFNILWVGRLIPTKRLDIALNALSLANNPKLKLTICGVGLPNEEEFYKNEIKRLKIEHQVNWLGKVNHSLIEPLMCNSDLFFFTSVAEATSTVVVEAISVGLPILSFNACGFGPLVTSFAGIAIELTNPQRSAIEFAEIINYLSSNPKKLKEISENQIANRHILSWEYKAKKMLDIYIKLIRI